MPKNQNDWWTKGDSLFGGETFESQDDSNTLGVKKGDFFRLEKKGLQIRLTAKPTNAGSWGKLHDKNHPIKLKELKHPKLNKRVFVMQVKIQLKPPKKQKFWLVERKTGEIL